MSWAENCRIWTCLPGKGHLRKEITKAQNEKVIYVYENWRKESPSLLGKLRSVFVRGQESFSFEYEPQWLQECDGAYSLDPDLARKAGGYLGEKLSSCAWLRNFIKK